MRKIIFRTKPELQDKLICIGLFSVFFIVSLPLMVNYCIDGTDVSFYLRQLEQGGAENLFFLIPKLLIRAGMPGESVYKMLFFLVNATTTLISYFCFKGIFSDKTVGLVGSMIYTWMPYRLNNLYCRGDLGEAIAMSFLPILCYGLYCLFSEDTATKAYEKLWVLLFAGYSLLLQAYLLSFLTAAGLTLALCLLQWKKTVRKPTLAVLIKTALAFGLFNAWTFGLLFYRFKMIQFPFGVVGNSKIQNRGVYLSNFFQLYFVNGSSNDVAKQGMQHMQPYGLGFVVTFCLLVYVWLRFVGRYRDKEEGKSLLRFAGTLTGLGCFLAVMTTNSFPWDIIQEKNSLFYSIIVCLYEPTRLMPLVGICLTVTACAVVWQIKRWESREISNSFLVAVAVIALLGTQYLTGDILRTGEPRSLYGVTYGKGVTEEEYQLPNLDISPLDYAKYEGSRNNTPLVFYGVEAVSVAGAGILVLLTGRKRRVEKV